MQNRIAKSIEMPQDILDISSIFKKNGKDLYLVGGAVRDSVIGKSPKDFDVATNATPDEVIGMLGGNYKVMEVGKAFGVIAVITTEFPDGIEVATFREDIGSGRRPNEVRFTDIESDVKRRDLTINALFYDLKTHEIVDYVGGINDIDYTQIEPVLHPINPASNVINIEQRERFG
jgi:tRNA nucleotidyltransferase/poly(A) polymerase